MSTPCLVLATLLQRLDGPGVKKPARCGLLVNEMVLAPLPWTVDHYLLSESGRVVVCLVDAAGHRIAECPSIDVAQAMAAAGWRGAAAADLEHARRQLADAVDAHHVAQDAVRGHFRRELEVALSEVGRLRGLLGQAIPARAHAEVGLARRSEMNSPAVYEQQSLL